VGLDASYTLRIFIFDFFEKISERIPESGIDVLFDIPNQLLEKIEWTFSKKVPKNVRLFNLILSKLNSPTTQTSRFWGFKHLDLTTQTSKFWGLLLKVQ
jgi:hypothetical protein